MLTFKKLFKSILLFFAIISCCFVFANWKKSEISLSEIERARHILHTLTKEEEKDLRTLIKYVNIWCQFPYTLFNGKPMSIAGIVSSYEELPSKMQQYYAPKKKVHDAYQRGFYLLQRLINEKNSEFSLHMFENIHCPGTSFIALIHIPSFKLVVKQNEEIFQHSAQTILSHEELCDAIFSGNREMQAKLFNNEHSLGTLLGFGSANAELYAKKQRSKLRNFNDEIFLSLKKWRLPGFLCDPTSEETKQLKELYRHIQSKIFWTYLGYDETLVTMALLLREKNI